MGHLIAWNLTARPKLSDGSKNTARMDASDFKTKRARLFSQKAFDPLNFPIFFLACRLFVGKLSTYPRRDPRCRAKN